MEKTKPRNFASRPSGIKSTDEALSEIDSQIAANRERRGPVSKRYDELYRETLEEGFRRYPLFTYFFPRLMDLYTSRGQYEKALALADSALAVNDSSELFIFAKSTVLLHLEKYAESIKYSEMLISRNPQLAEPYFNAGTAYVNIAGRLDQRRERKLMRKSYEKARPYIEQYRQMMPKEQDKWAPVLYRIYLNLNMGKQFDEIDRLIREK